jgi:hypothetical protein
LHFNFRSAEKARFYLESHPLHFPLSIFPESAFTRNLSAALLDDSDVDTDSLDFLSSENPVPMRVAVRPAPPMADLVWPHLAWSPWNRAIRIALANLLLLVLVIFFTAFSLLPVHYSLSLSLSLSLAPLIIFPDCNHFDQSFTHSQFTEITLRYFGFELLRIRLISKSIPSW